MRLVLIIFVLLLTTCGIEPSGKPIPPAKRDLQLTPNQPIGRLRGYDAINSILRQRFLDKASHGFELNTYLTIEETKKNRFEFNKPTLKGLLGAYEGRGLKQEFVGGRPNPFNMLLWYVVIANFSSDVARNCKQPSKAFALNKVMNGAIQELCGLAKQKEWNETKLAGVWESMIASDAPRASYEEWRAFLKARHNAKLRPSEFVQEAVIAALYQPYFLAEH